ncbi:hypothetical protein [Amycolatopsis sp. NPDC051903]
MQALRRPLAAEQRIGERGRSRVVSQDVPGTQGAVPPRNSS